MKYLKECDSLLDVQSAYRVHQSTDTAVLKILPNILLVYSKGNEAILMLSDLSYAFDSMLDHHDRLV
jgi:hypothetical protein